MSEEVIFDKLNLRIPDSVKTYSVSTQRDVFAYLQEMNDIQRKAYSIAFDHLESSFDIVRSNGFQDWIKKRVNT